MSEKIEKIEKITAHEAVDNVIQKWNLDLTMEEIDGDIREDILLAMHEIFMAGCVYGDMDSTLLQDAIDFFSSRDKEDLQNLGNTGFTAL